VSCNNNPESNNRARDDIFLNEVFKALTRPHIDYSFGILDSLHVNWMSVHVVEFQDLVFWEQCLFRLYEISI